MKQTTNEIDSNSCNMGACGVSKAGTGAGSQQRWGRSLFSTLLCCLVAMGCSASGDSREFSQGDDDVSTEGLSDDDLEVLESSYTETEIIEREQKATNKKGCSSAEKGEIDSAISFVKSRWSEYENAVEQDTGLNIKGCLENRFKDNGKYHCESKTVHGCNSTLLGRNNFLSNVAHICPNGMRQITARSTLPNRRASYAALLAHEWAHSCARNEKNSDKIDLATFNFIKSVDSSVTDLSCVSCQG